MNIRLKYFTIIPLIFLSILGVKILSIRTSHAAYQSQILNQILPLFMPTYLLPPSAMVNSITSKFCTSTIQYSPTPILSDKIYFYPLSSDSKLLASSIIKSGNKYFYKSIIFYITTF